MPSRTRGRGAITLTGQMGEVMQESVEAALGLVRARCAVPKDGPSAGIAMFTALASLFTDTPTPAQATGPKPPTRKGRATFTNSGGVDASSVPQPDAVGSTRRRTDGVRVRQP